MQRGRVRRRRMRPPLLTRGARLPPPSRPAAACRDLSGVQTGKTAATAACLPRPGTTRPVAEGAHLLNLLSALLLLATSRCRSQIMPWGARCLLNGCWSGVARRLQPAATDKQIMMPSSSLS
jgi:hypothetical protein